MVHSLQECRETNRNLMEVLENMQQFIDASKTGKHTILIIKIVSVDFQAENEAEEMRIRMQSGRRSTRSISQYQNP